MAAITTDELRGWASITATDPGTTAALDEVVATTNSVISRRVRADVLTSDPPELHNAALVLAARLYKRRASPEGVAGLGDLGVIRIAPRDEDVEALLSPWLKVAFA